MRIDFSSTRFVRCGNRISGAPCHRRDAHWLIPTQELGARGPRPLPLRDVGGPALAPERRAAPLERQGPPGDLQRVGVLLWGERWLGRVINRHCC